MFSRTEEQYKIYSKGTKAAVLLIHGITGTPAEMRFIARTLKKEDYGVFCNTLPHHCSSLEELKKATWQEIVESCIDDFNFLKKENDKVFIAGLSMGALVAMHLACKLGKEVCGIIALAPTLFYDGWAVHKGKVLLPLVWHIPFLRNSINIPEGWPYGLKDETLRRHIERFYTEANSGDSSEKVVVFGSPFFPLASLYQLNCFAKVVKKEMPSVKNPILVIHAKEDDMTSIKNAEYVFKNIGSSDKTFIMLENSYHMITIDNEKEKVVDETIKFLDRLSSAK